MSSGVEINLILIYAFSIMKDITRKTNVVDLLIGGVLGSISTLIIGSLTPKIIIAEIIWGFAFVFIIILLFSRH